MEKQIKLVEQPYLSDKDENIVSVGDTIKVHLKVVEGNRVRIQIFEGIVISIRGTGLGKTIKIRKISYGIGVEKTFMLHSPIINKLEIVKQGHPRRAKLFYLRNRVGKKALKVRARSKLKNSDMVSETHPPKNSEKSQELEKIEAYVEPTQSTGIENKKEVKAAAAEVPTTEAPSEKTKNETTSQATEGAIEKLEKEKPQG